MSIFDDRENAYENKFVHDQESQFKITARRNKLLGLWAAEKKHLKDEEAEEYAKEVVAAALEGDIALKVMTDLEAAGVMVEEKELREQMHTLMDVAREQLRKS